MQNDYQLPDASPPGCYAPNDLQQLTQQAQETANALLINWARERWNAEVKNRPLINVNRRPLDDTWRQVIRYAGGDPAAILGPAHDDLLVAHNSKVSDGGGL